ncbi:uncharacterized protein LOC141622048 [Silene latifolia]|uniref:uncharacterized protein LOC141622048 n=1 Tax=Silene latifolia TaxID=37657 RepID=UPI003D76FC63
MGVERENDDVDFEVSLPGQRYHSKDAPYNFRNSVDPRFSKSLIDLFFVSDEFSDSDAEEPRGPVELIKPTKKTKEKKMKKRKLEGTSGDSKPETGCGVIKSGPGVRSKEAHAKLNINLTFKCEDIELGSTEISKEELARLRYKNNTPFKQRHREMLKKDRKDWEANKERIFRDRDIRCAKKERILQQETLLPYVSCSVAAFANAFSSS